MAEIIIYTKKECPFSKECKSFFDDKKIAYTELCIDNDSECEFEMITKSGNRTDTPQVFINNHHIGSFDDIKVLESQGMLQNIIKGQ